jgi:ribbon-helix-helix CopG family protein
MPFSLRLDRDTESRIRRLSTLTGRSKSQVVRDAIAQYAPVDESASAGDSTFDRLKPYVGVARTGGRNYSSDTHRKYRALLQKRRRARRAR